MNPLAFSGTAAIQQNNWSADLVEAASANGNSVGYSQVQHSDMSPLDMVYPTYGAGEDIVAKVSRYGGLIAFTVAVGALSLLLL